MKVQTKRKITIFFIFLVAFMIMAALIVIKPKPPKKSLEDNRLFVDVIELVASDVTFEISSQGTVQPRTKTILSSEVSGRVISISERFIPGGFFKKDEILMQIDDTDYVVAKAQSEALLRQRQIEYNGAKSLSIKGYRAEAELAAAKANLAAAKANLVKANKNLNRTKIRLPYDGFVLSKDADLGQFVNPGSKLGTTLATNVAEIRLALTDQDLAFLDMPKPSYSDAPSEHRPSVKLFAIHKGQSSEWYAEIIRSEGVVDDKSRLTYVVAKINDPYQLSSSEKSGSDDSNTTQILPMGTFVKATIIGKTISNIIKIPRTAIRGKNELMFIDDDNRLQIKTVNILRADADFAYISSGAKAGDRISITAIESPINGMEVRTAGDPEIETDSASKTLPEQIEQ